MKVGLAIERVARSEARLADRLVEVGARHKPDHDVFHVTRTLANLERGHLDSLAPHAERYDASLDNGGGGLPGPPELVRTVVEKGGVLLGRRPEASLLLLRDLRELHLLAAEASIDWVALGQGAQAVRDTDLLEAVSECHTETLRTLKWTTYRIKTAAPQILAS